MNDVPPLSPADEAALSPRRGLSPLVLIFLISGIIGLVIAGVTLLGEDRAGPAPEGSTQNVIGSNAPRPLAGGRPAPAFTLTTLAGAPLSLADLAGRPVFLNFWATWCGPCVREMPAFQTFAREQRLRGDDGAVVLAINFGETEEDITPFLRELGVGDLTTLLDPDLRTANAYGVGNLPTTYLIAADGTLAFLKLGEMTLDEMNEYLAALQPEEAAP